MDTEITDFKLLETYQHRISEIQNVSDTIAIANLQLNKLLQKFGWSRQFLLKENILVGCPVDDSHVVKKDNVNKHVQVCTIRKHGILSMTDKELTPSSSYSYETSDLVVPVFVNEDQYKKIGVSINQSKLEDIKKDEPTNAAVQTVSLLEQDGGINEYKPCDPLDELRFIYTWQKIPKSYWVLQSKQLPDSVIKAWLEENIPSVTLTGIQSGNLIPCITEWLKETPTPETFISHLKNFFGQETSQFVLQLWKFVTAKSLCLNQHIPEHTRNEFDFYGTALIKKNKASASGVDRVSASYDGDTILSLLPMEWAFYHLTKEQKLHIYELVCQNGKLVANPSFEYADLAAETEKQVKVLTAFEEEGKGQKTHLQVMAELRDYKRRRQSYRGKNKSKKKMSGTEVLRELIEQQMLYLKILHSSKIENKVDEKVCDESAINSESQSSADTLPRNMLESQKFNRSRSSSKDRTHRGRRNRNGSRERRSRSREKEESHRYTREKEHSTRRERRRSRSREKRHRSRSRERKRERSRSKDSRCNYKDDKQRNSRHEITNVTYYGETSG